MKRNVCWTIPALALALCSAGAQAQTTLGIEGSRFTVNGNPTFLLGVSYYGALGAPARARGQDLEDMQRDGFNWIRVWATWAAFHTNLSAVESNGAPREPFLDRLEQLVADCDRRGLIVDVTLSRQNGATGPPRLLTLADHRRAVETLIERLRPYRNWYLDLANERSIRDIRFVSHAELKVLRDRAKEIDPRRLITASHSSSDDDFLRELDAYVKTTRVDFLSPHRPRHRGSSDQTAAMTRRCLERMGERGVVVPVHHQEPFRRGFGAWEPTADDFLRDLRGAIQGGAAGWCFHNGSQGGNPDLKPRRSFDLSDQRLYAQWDEVEQTVLKGLKAVRDKAPGREGNPK